MMRSSSHTRIAGWIALVLFVGLRGWASELLEEEMETALVPGPLQFSVLLPDGYAPAGEPYPLLLLLHGGNGSRAYLSRMRPLIDELWRSGRLPPMVVATPSAGRSLYMDYRDGSEKWESLLIGPFLDHLTNRFNVSEEAGKRLLSGISMGGMGSLRLAFKYPDRFGAVAALEPGIDPVLHFKDLQPRNRFWRSDAFFETAFGSPVDADYWSANNPASIVAAQPEKIRASGLQIYIECGDEDFFLLDEATEFLHRILWDNEIPHEYHLVRGANHVGRTVRARTAEALEFLGKTLNPPSDPDPQVQALERRLGGVKERVLRGN